MGLEQKLSSQAPESPAKVLNRIVENRQLREKMDVPAFLQDVNLLDQMGTTKGPKTLEYLRHVGRDKLIWGSLLNRIIDNNKLGDGQKVVEDLRLAQVLGMDQLPKTATFLSHLRNKYREQVGPTEALQEILEKAGKRNVEEVRLLISGVEKILVCEQQEGENKLGKTIQETQKGRNGQEYFVDGEIAYLPSKGRAVFVGDTHGDSLATESITKQAGFIENMERGPKDMTLVFLGDYADRGANDIRNLEIVLALKERYPQNVILLRGNHEEGGGFDPYELPESLRRHFGIDRGNEFHERYVNLFKQLPNMLVTANGIVAVHAGVPNKNIHSLQGLRNDEEAFSQIRWNDPNATIQETQKNYRRGGFYEFGQGPFERFIRAIGGKVIIRSHEYPQDGYELFFSNRLVTIFSNGGVSPESHYQGRVQPKFMVTSLEEPISEIIPAKHLVDLKYSTS